MNFALDPKIQTTQQKQRYKNTNFKKINVKNFLQSQQPQDDSQILQELTQNQNHSINNGQPLNQYQILNKKKNQHFRNKSEANLRAKNQYIDKILCEYEEHNIQKQQKKLELEQFLSTEQFEKNNNSNFKNLQRSLSPQEISFKNTSNINPEFIPFTKERDRTGKLISHKRSNSNTLLAKKNSYQAKSPDKIKTRDQTTYHTLDRLRVQKHQKPTWKQLDIHYQNKVIQQSDGSKQIVPFERSQIISTEEQEQQEIIDQKLNHLFDINEGADKTNNKFSVNLSQNINFDTSLIKSPDNTLNNTKQQTNFQQYTQLQAKKININKIQSSVFDSPLQKKNKALQNANRQKDKAFQSVGHINSQQTLDNEISTYQQNYSLANSMTIKRKSQDTFNSESFIEPQYNSKQKNSVNAIQQVLELNKKFTLQTYKQKNEKIINNMKINFFQGKAKSHKQHKDKTRMQTQYTKIQQPLNTDTVLTKTTKYNNPIIKSKAKENNQPKLNYFHADYSKEQEPQPDKYQQIMEQIKERKQILPILKVGKNNSILQEAFQQRQHKKNLQRNLVGDEEIISGSNISQMFYDAKHSHKQLKNEMESWKTKDFDDLEMQKRLQDVQL